MAFIDSIVGKSVQSGLNTTLLKSPISAAFEITSHTNTSKAIADVSKSIRSGQNYLILVIKQ
jgi:hypothetical protein